MKRSSLATSSKAEDGRPKYVPINIGAERKGVLRGGLIDLELSLTSEPDSEWTRVFENTDSTRDVRSRQIESPRVQRDKVRISIRESDLGAAWTYVNACIDHANAVSRDLFYQRVEQTR
jgi:hypothetical protein